MKRLKEWYDRLAERERRLVLIFLGVLVLFAAFVIPYATSMALDAKRTHIADLREAIRAVQNSRDKMADRKLRRGEIAARYAQRAPPLAGFMENAARAGGLAIPESQDMSDVPHGKRFTERTTIVRLRKVGMLALTRMLERIESSGYAVVISKLHLRRRGGETDSYDVELSVSAFDSASAPPATGDMTKPLDSARPATSSEAPAILRPSASGEQQ